MSARIILRSRIIVLEAHYLEIAAVQNSDAWAEILRALATPSPSMTYLWERIPEGLALDVPASSTDNKGPVRWADLPEHYQSMRGLQDSLLHSEHADEYVLEATYWFSERGRLVHSAAVRAWQDVVIQAQNGFRTSADQFAMLDDTGHQHQKMITDEMVGADMAHLPNCDLCTRLLGKVSQAQYDAKVQESGAMAFLCRPCFIRDGIGLGTSIGQLLMLLPNN